MKYYCAMILTGEEKDFIKKIREAVCDKYPESTFWFFERRLYTPKRGWFSGAIFPGYVFFSVEDLTPDFLGILRATSGFCKLLLENKEPTQIQGTALEQLKLFIRNGEEWGVSKVVFLPGQKVKAVSGPLVGLEGNIIHVNKKYKQITVQATVVNMSMQFDLKFENAEKVEGNV